LQSLIKLDEILVRKRATVVQRSVEKRF